MKKKLIWIMVYLIIATGIPPIQANASTVSIPSSAKQYRGHYYKAYKDDVSWEKAKQRCEAKGGHLVTMTSAGEATFVESLVENDEFYWIGARRVNGNG